MNQSSPTNAESTPLQGRLNWANIVVLFASPIVAVLATSYYVLRQGIELSDLICFFSMIFLTGIAITAGYHRYYSHKSYECHPTIRLFYMLFGAGAMQAPALDWVSDHRNHHRFVDRDGDPYNIQRGFLWAHMGWAFHRDPEPKTFSNIRDLVDDKLLLAQKRFHLPIGIVVGFGLPFLLGMMFDRPWGGLLWGGLLRLVVAHHLTFLVNSMGHSFGRRPYSDLNSSRDSTLLALFTLGEGYHNFHHTFPGDYRNGIRLHHWDPTKWWIFALSLIGLAWRLNRTPAERAFRKRATSQVGKDAIARSRR
jgi:stearoyl-CoA desaturase (delta-9 desaturase)